MIELWKKVSASSQDLDLVPESYLPSAAWVVACREKQRYSNSTLLGRKVDLQTRNGGSASQLEFDVVEAALRRSSGIAVCSGPAAFLHWESRS
jgi:hypothetical protein